MFRTVPLSIIRSFSLYTQQWYVSYRFAGSLRAGSGRNCSSVLILLCVQWKTPYDGQRICPKHVEFYSKNKSEELVHLVGFIVRIYHDARSPERQKKKKVRVSLKFVAQRSDNNRAHASTESLLFPYIQITLRNERTHNNKHFAKY